MSERTPISSVVLSTAVPFPLGLAISLSCYSVCGVWLGLFFGPLLLIPFIVPQLTVGQESNRRRAIVPLMMALGVWLVWAMTANLSAFDAARCGLVLMAFCGALAGGASLLDRIGLGRTCSAGVTSVTGFAWLTWPVWLCPWFGHLPQAQAIVNWLSFAHPLMAMNSILFERFNFWDRYPLAYQQLTTLNQDLLYNLPRSILPMVCLHGAIGAAGLATGLVWKRSRQRAMAMEVPEPV